MSVHTAGVNVNTVQQVADRLHVHPQTVREWIRSGQLGALEVSKPDARFKRYRITDDQLEEFIAGRTVA